MFHGLPSADPFASSSLVKSKHTSGFNFFSKFFLLRLRKSLGAAITVELNGGDIPRNGSLPNMEPENRGGIPRNGLFPKMFGFASLEPVKKLQFDRMVNSQAYQIKLFGKKFDSPKNE